MQYRLQCRCYPHRYYERWVVESRVATDCHRWISSTSSWKWRRFFHLCYNEIAIIQDPGYNAKPYAAAQDNIIPKNFSQWEKNLSSPKLTRMFSFTVREILRVLRFALRLRFYTFEPIVRDHLVHNEPLSDLSQTWTPYFVRYSEWDFTSSVASRTLPSFKIIDPHKSLIR